ncbi:MAG: fructose-6-phosphate aldolase [Hyphomonas sp.]|uniref:fructose-6-phosphate aldolase n=1 Tax=Hyphomonas sp. TaxID=87 RepID=UPI0017C31A3B|nr:fructose-6-phosphate aldolase [Hyphomonas sp.]MBA3068815.1 fructose-6-phosphate aldolase [Hyphomonas sp.]MBU3919388.1 fructose-6-phosphate aldolase [Alphaproteobacteria bacterium]MBU4062974.1 fructose-6-phosphate aldolase [Alphaproteobacteria bacterium]MBU4165506.1 fructose-6-phosphate aldolase [Alphaproteobacteria bacterium]
MKFFVDTADTKDIADLAATGLIDGVTTNPSLIAKSGRPFAEVIAEICALVDGPVSAEVVATDYDGMIKEGRKLAKIANNVTVKLPLTLDGLKACKTLTGEGTQVNVTLCFSANQALLAAKAGATFISPFIGRLDDINLDGMELIQEIRQIYDNYLFDTEILAASIRTPNHVKLCALVGADVMTAPPAVIKSLVNHPLTDKGLETFLADAKKAGIKV